VISIIGVLVGLLMSGVMAALAAKNRTGNSYDISKMDESMGAATTTYGKARTLPGQIVLYNNMDVYRSPTTYGIVAGSYEEKVMLRSKEALRKMFGARFITNGGNNNAVNPGYVSWDGTSGASVNKNPIILEGQQCLVFYLGGMPQVNAAGTFARPVGFSIDPTDPTKLPAKPGEDRIGPFYEFEGGRLVAMPTRIFSPVAADPFATTVNANTTFLAYNDRYGTPYAYFGGTGGSNTHISFCPSLPCPNNPARRPRRRW